VVLIVLAAGGVGLGLIWQAMSPRAKGFVYLPQVVIPDEKESLVASDGRFLLLTGAAGIVVAGAAWLRRSARGPATALALVGGGLLGALLTDLVGRLAGGGHDTGALNSVVTLPVRVHARGLLLAEPALAALVCAACALFARRDDLGTDETGRAAKVMSVRPGPGEAVGDWANRRIEVTLDREVEGAPDWLRAFAGGDGGYAPLTLEPLASSPAAGGAVTYRFAVSDPPARRPFEVLVRLVHPSLDARSLDGDGQWAFTVIEVDTAP
jgi:hypothetical protein